MNKINIYDPAVAYIDGKSNREILIYWLLGNFCTYRCSYCGPHFNSGDIPYHNTQLMQEGLKKLPPSTVLFGGGEPTFHPDFEKIVLEKPDHINIAVITNGSRPIAFWERIVSKLHRVFLSYHIEYAQFDRFLSLSKLVYRTYGKSGRISIMMLPSKWDECVDIYHRFVDAGIPIIAKAIIDDWKTINKEYTSEQLNWISSSAWPRQGGQWIRVYDKDHNVLHTTDAAELMSNKMVDYSGWTCHVPRYYINIGMNGDMRNTCCPHGKKLGNIYTGFELSVEPIICPANECVTYCDIEGIKAPPSYNGPIPGIG
jgi:MoaA/NifB/PqqE/SkfB family radical SAM enzyme